MKRTAIEKLSGLFSSVWISAIMLAISIWIANVFLEDIIIKIFFVSAMTTGSFFLMKYAFKSIGNLQVMCNDMEKHL